MEFINRPLEIPQWLRDMGFDDCSKSYDTRARAIKWVSVGQYVAVCVWVDLAPINCREGSQYEVELLRNIENWFDGLAQVMYEGEDQSKAEAAIRSGLMILRREQQILGRMMR